MITTIATKSRKIVALLMTGKLHDQDYKQFLPKLETLLAAERKSLLFVQMENFHGWDLRAAWDDFKFDLKHYCDFERIAMVGERNWERWMTDLSEPFTSAEVMYFERSDVDAAWKWLDSDEDNLATDKAKRTLTMFDKANQWERSRWYGPI